MVEVKVLAHGVSALFDPAVGDDLLRVGDNAVEQRVELRELLVAQAVEELHALAGIVVADVPCGPHAVLGELDLCAICIAKIRHSLNERLRLELVDELGKCLAVGTHDDAQVLDADAVALVAPHAQRGKDAALTLDRRELFLVIAIADVFLLTKMMVAFYVDLGAHEEHVELVELPEHVACCGLVTSKDCLLFSTHGVVCDSHGAPSLALDRLLHKASMIDPCENAAGPEQAIVLPDGDLLNHTRP